MEVLMVAQSSVLECDAMTLVAKLLTLCAEVWPSVVFLCYLHILAWYQKRHVDPSLLFLFSTSMVTDHVWETDLNCCIFSSVKWISSCVAILSAMLRYHLSTAISCASVVLTIIGNILWWLTLMYQRWFDIHNSPSNVTLPMKILDNCTQFNTKIQS